MIVIGIAGGIASGKSFVTSLFEKLGSVALDADRLGHTLLRDQSVVELIERNWGRKVLREDGSVDRSKLAKIVFAENGGDDLRKLEQITHPRIRKQIEEQISHLKTTKQYPAVILDAPVMFKSGWSEICDVIVFVETDESIRIQRAKERGWTREEYQKRESNQFPLSEKKRLSTFTIDNNHSMEHVFTQVKSIWNQLISN